MTTFYKADPSDNDTQALEKLLESARRTRKPVQLELRGFRITAHPDDRLDVLERQLAAAALERDLNSNARSEWRQRIRSLERNLIAAENTVGSLRKARAQQDLVRIPSGWVAREAVEQIRVTFGAVVLHLRSGAMVVTEGNGSQVLTAFGIAHQEASEAIAASLPKETA